MWDTVARSYEFLIEYELRRRKALLPILPPNHQHGDGSADAPVNGKHHPIRAASDRSGGSEGAAEALQTSSKIEHAQIVADRLIAFARPGIMDAEA